MMWFLAVSLLLACAYQANAFICYNCYSNTGANESTPFNLPPYNPNCSSMYLNALSLTGCSSYCLTVFYNNSVAGNPNTSFTGFIRGCADKMLLRPPPMEPRNCSHNYQTSIPNINTSFSVGVAVCSNSLCNGQSPSDVLSMPSDTCNNPCCPNPCAPGLSCRPFLDGINYMCINGTFNNNCTANTTSPPPPTRPPRSLFNCSLTVRNRGGYALQMGWETNIVANNSIVGSQHSYNTILLGQDRRISVAAGSMISLHAVWGLKTGCPSSGYNNNFYGCFPPNRTITCTGTTLNLNCNCNS